MPKCPFCKLHTDTGNELQDHLALKHPEEIVDSSGVRNTRARKFKKNKQSHPIVVDGNNVCYWDDTPEISNLKTARGQLMRSGYKPTIFVSSALRHSIDQPAELNRLINLGWVVEVDGGQDDDVQIIEEAQRKKCAIVSNDNFREYIKAYTTDTWKLSNKIRNFSFESGKFVLK